MKIDEQRKFASELCKEVSGVYDSLSCYDDSELAGILRVEMDYILKAANVIDQLSNELDAANQKLDMAVNDLEFVVHQIGGFDCAICRHAGKQACNDCNWEWRGIQNTVEW